MKLKTGIVKYGIIGAGMMGREHLCNIRALDGAEVVAIADPHVPSQEAALALSPGLKVFSDHKALLDSGVCDVLVVSTPNNTHAEILLDILKHSTPHHVLVEKPLCTRIEDCYKVLEAAKARPEVLVQVGLEYRYMPPVAKLINMVKSNSLGRVKMVAIREHRFPFLVKVQNWNRFNSNTGGTLVEKCCHFFDLMNLITGARPIRVMASGAQDVNHLDESYNDKVPDIIDNAYVIVEYDNGVRSMLDLCMFAEGGNNEQEICVVATTYFVKCMGAVARSNKRCLLLLLLLLLPLLLEQLQPAECRRIQGRRSHQRRSRHRMQHSFVNHEKRAGGGGNIRVLRKLSTPVSGPNPGGNSVPAP